MSRFRLPRRDPVDTTPDEQAAADLEHDQAVEALITAITAITGTTEEPR